MTQRTEKEILGSIEDYARAAVKDTKDMANWVVFFGILTILGVLSGLVMLGLSYS